MICSGKVK